ncbi:MAG: CCA tRNA nucleotidyltransferase [Candidatus Aenigmatarchaeota archaeon]
MNLSTVLSKIRPDARECKKMDSFIKRLIKTSEKLSSEARPIICGSAEKDTWLSKKNEVDLFLLFDSSLSKVELEKRGMGLAKSIVKKLRGKYQIAFAEHPYIKSRIGCYDVDIVPCYDIENPERIKSSVDRTPHHVKFVKSKLKNPDEVRLLKQFCIANGCYGADVKTLGFSGYLCELLIIKYGSFEKLAKTASKWRAGHIITFNNSTEEQARLFKTPLVVIDPVDRNRNVAAAVSMEKFYTFVDACKKFNKKPSKELFLPSKPKPYTITKLTKIIKRRGTRWYHISFAKPKVVNDILYPQMKRCTKAVGNMLTRNGFRVLRSDFFCNDGCHIVLEMEEWEIPRIYKNIGPDVYSRHVEEFIKHYQDKKVFIENDNWLVELEREFVRVSDYLKNLFSLSERELKEKGIPSKISPKIRKANLFYDNGFLMKAKKSKDLRIFLKEWLEKDLDVV